MFGRSVRLSAMRLTLTSVVLGVLAAVAPSAAIGEDQENFTIDVLPGRPALIHDRAYYDTVTCKIDGYPEFVVSDPPTKGTLSATQTSWVSAKGACAGKRVYGLALNYTANYQATGSDRLVFRRLFKGVVEMTGYVTIHIK